MNAEGARQLVDQHLEELMALEEQIASGSRRVSALRKVIQGYMEMFPELEQQRGALVEAALEDSEGGEDAPRGMAAVIRIMQERPGYPWLVSELVEEMRLQNWLPSSQNPANAIRSAVVRLAADPERTDVYKETVYRDGSEKVAYKYDPDRAPDAPSGSNYYDEEPF